MDTRDENSSARTLCGLGSTDLENEELKICNHSEERIRLGAAKHVPGRTGAHAAPSARARPERPHTASKVPQVTVSGARPCAWRSASRRQGCASCGAAAAGAPHVR